MDKLLLILDLDETLVYATEKPLEHAPAINISSYSVYERPGVRDFIRSCSAESRLAVWTSSSREYAECIVDWLFDGIPLEFMWARERCTERYDPETFSHYWIKNLKKVRNRRYDLARVLMVDDTARKLEQNYGNHIRVSPFEGDLQDDELAALMTYLGRFRDLPDVRPQEKRGWRHQIEQA